MGEQTRLVELLAALSLTTDLGSGVAFEKGLRTCLVARAPAEALIWPELSSACRADRPGCRRAVRVVGRVGAGRVVDAWRSG